MSQIIPLLIFSTLVSISHGSALIYAKSQQNHPYKKRERAWQVHSFINGSLWLVLSVWILWFQWASPHSAYPLWLETIGFITLIAGLCLSVKSRLLLGPHQAMGIRFFLPEKSKKITSSLYSFLNNPMYDGFILILMSMGLIFGVEADFYLAALSFILLNIFLASIENYRWRWNPF